MLVTYPEERYFYCCISSIFLIYSLLEHMGSLCACGPFHADPTFLHDFLRGWNGCGGDTNGAKNPSLGLATVFSSLYCSC